MQFLKDDIGTNTKTHFLRALSAAMVYYTISKDNRLYFDGKLINKSQIGSMLLGHKELSKSHRSYDYITVSGLDLGEAARIYKVTDEKLVSTMAAQLLQLEPQIKQLIQTVADLNQKVVDLQSASTATNGTQKGVDYSDLPDFGVYPKSTSNDSESERKYYDKLIVYLNSKGISSNLWVYINQLPGNKLTKSVYTRIRKEISHEKMQVSEISEPVNKKQKIDI
jgi:hypothetical protein